MTILTPTIRRKLVTYSDFHKDLTQNPINLDLARKIDEEAVKESIKNLVLTDKMERPFQPDLGCNVRKMLFENVGQDTLIMIETMIRETIEAYEPRCNLVAVDASSNVDDNRVVIRIVFNVVNKEDPVLLEFALKRVR